MKRPSAEAWLVVAVSSALLLGLAASGVYALAGALRGQRDSLDEVQARYARLEGLRAAAPAIARSLVEVEETLARHAHPAADGADRLGTDLQQRARRVADEAGMRVTGSQILPARTSGGLSRVPVTLTVEGSQEALRGMLLGLGEQRPTVLVDGLVVQRGDETAPYAPPLTVQLDLSVLQLAQ